MTRQEFIEASSEEQLNYICKELHTDMIPKLSERTDPKQSLICQVAYIRPDPHTKNKDEFAYIHPVNCLDGTPAPFLFRDAHQRNKGNGFKPMRCPLKQLPDGIKEKTYIYIKYKVISVDKDTLFIPLAPLPNTARIFDDKWTEGGRTILRTDELLLEEQNVQNRLTTLKQEKTELEQEIANLREENRTLIQNREDDLLNIQRHIEQTLEKADLFHQMGFKMPDLMQPTQTKNPSDTNGQDFPALAKQTTACLRSQKKLFYDLRIIQEFLGAMFSNQIIILSGPPGTGKSSLPPAVADCLGAECHIISVQPSWTDNQDLLGFYDPIHERYVSTPFMDLLADAAQPEKQDTIHLICLDEMNLAQIEYYFSEILSAMETDKKILRLYSQHIFQTRRDQLLHRIDQHPDSEEFKTLSTEEEKLNWVEAHKANDSLWAEWEHLSRYPAQFRIPDNVQFVGTLNMDESTKNLSPKVLDRSYVIEIGASDSFRSQTGSPAEDVKSTDVTRSAFKPIKYIPETYLKQLWIDTLVDLIREEIQELSVSYSHRVKKQIQTLLAQGQRIDDILLGKLFPSMKLRVPSEQSTQKLYDLLTSEQTTKKLQKKLSTPSDSAEIAEEIKEKLPDLFPQKTTEEIGRELYNLLISEETSETLKLENSLKKLRNIYDSDIQELNYWRT